MARPGVTYHDVAKAAAHIRDQGYNPTVDRVLVQLGTGSKSTLAPLLKQWKAQQLGDEAAAALPVEVVTAVKALHEQLQQRAEHTVAQAREEFDALADELRATLTQAKSEIHGLQRDKQTLENRLQCLEADNAALNSTLEQARLEAAACRAELAEVRTQLSEAKTLATERLHELRQAHTQFEHYQEQMAEDRQHERDQYRHSQQQLEGRIHELIQHLDRERARSNALEGSLQQAAADNARCHHTLEEINNEKNVMALDAVRKADTISALKRAKTEVETRMNTLEVQYDAVVKSRAEEKAAYRLAEQQLVKVQDELRQLSDENKELLQEKACLEGRLTSTRHRKA